MKILILVLTSSLIIGCANKTPVTVYDTVEVKTVVYKAPEFTIPPIPELPVNKLNWSNLDDHNAIGKAYVLTVDVLENHILQLRNLLEGIKKGDSQ